MTFKIVKKGANNFWHLFDGKNISISDFEVVLDENANTFVIVLKNGANIPQIKLDISDIIVNDETVGGVDETFTNATELRNRLVILGYTAYLGAGNADAITGLIVAGTNVTITGSGTLADSYIINATGGGGSQDLESVLNEGNIAYDIDGNYVNLFPNGISFGYSGVGTPIGDISMTKEAIVKNSSDNLNSQIIDFEEPTSSETLTIPNESGTFASREYVDNKVAGLLDLRGNYDASSNVFPSSGGSGTGGAILKGDFWFVSVAGTLNGEAVNIGDSFYAMVDSPTSSQWEILQANLDYVPENVANKENTALDTSTSKYPTNRLVKEITDTKQNTAKLISANYTALNNEVLIVNATCTISDVASPTNGTNYEVTIVNGNVTIGGVVYTSGVVVTRIFNSGSWKTCVNADFIDWTDFSATSTITSWVTPSVSFLQYTKTGRVLTIRGRITGTSNSDGNPSLTIPFTLANLGVGQGDFSLLYVNNGILSATAGVVVGTNNSNVIQFFRDGTLGGLSFSSSGTKTIAFLSTFIIQ